MRTVEAAPAILVVDVLREAVLLQQLVRRVLELGQGLRGAAHVAQGGGSLRRAGVGAEGARDGEVLARGGAAAGGGRPDSPDGGRTRAVLSGVHHPAHVALHGRVGAVPGLPLPRRLETFRCVSPSPNPIKGRFRTEASFLPWRPRADFPSPPGRSAASWWGPCGEGCEASGACGRCGSWATRARSSGASERWRWVRGPRTACWPKRLWGLWPNKRASGTRAVTVKLLTRFVPLTLLRSRRPWGNFLVGVHRGLRRQAVELFTADQVDLLEILHLLLQKGGDSMLFSSADDKNRVSQQASHEIQRL